MSSNLTPASFASAAAGQSRGSRGDGSGDWYVSVSLLFLCSACFGSSRPRRFLVFISRRFHWSGIADTSRSRREGRSANGTMTFRRSAAAPSSQSSQPAPDATVPTPAAPETAQPLQTPSLPTDRSLRYTRDQLLSLSTPATTPPPSTRQTSLSAAGIQHKSTAPREAGERPPRAPFPRIPPSAGMPAAASNPSGLLR